MDTRFLQTLVCAVEGGSFAAAARSLNLTPPAVAQRIRAIEQILDTVLVERSGNTIAPTPVCINLMERIRKIIREVELLHTDLGDELSGLYRLGAITTALTDHASKLVTTFSDVAPRADLILTPGSSIDLFGMVERGELDAAIIVKPPFTLLKTLTISEIERQPLAWVQSARTGSEKLILYDRSSWGGRVAWEWLEKNRPNIEKICEIDVPETVALLASQGFGKAVLPVWRGLASMEGLRIEPIVGKDYRSIVFLKKNSASSKLDILCEKALMKEYT